MSARPVLGLLVAAGRGRRLGGDKQLRSWDGGQGGRTLVAAAFDALRPACDELLVVLGHRADEVAAALGPRVFRPVRADPDGEMLDSIRAGLVEIARITTAADVLVHPADHPAVDPSTLRALLAARDAHPARAIVPVFEGRGGHPVLVADELRAAIGEYRGDGGLRGYWREHPGSCVRLEVADPWVVRDVDRPEDLAGRT